MCIRDRVRRGGDHRPLGGIAPAPDDDRKPDQLRAAQQLDGHEELVHVDMKHPALVHVLMPRHVPR